MSRLPSALAPTPGAAVQPDAGPPARWWALLAVAVLAAAGLWAAVPDAGSVDAAPTALAVMGLQLGYLLGGSILIETVFAWPGTGFLLNAAIFQRDLPLLQGTILVLAMFFVFLNLVVDVLQTALDPRIQRA